MRYLRLASALGASILLSCIDTGSQRFELGYSVESTGTHTFAGRDGWTVTLEDAHIAFGPIYLCQATRPGDFCEVAVAEQLVVQDVDVLAGDRRSLGTLTATAQTVRSYMAELGRPWAYTDRRATALDDTVLGGHSLRLSGFGEDGTGRRVNFSAELDFSGSQVGTVPVRVDLDQELQLSPGSSITLRFDPERWFPDLDFEVLHDDDGPDVQTVELESDTQAYRSLRLALVANATPELIFNERD